MKSAAWCLAGAWALVTLMGCSSSAPALPKAPELPTLPTVPEIPTVPELPSIPSTEGGFLEALGSMKDKALETIGLKKPELPKLPEVPDSAMPDWRLQWKVYASGSLNVDERGQPLALLTRIYKLKSPDAFLSAPIDTFGDAAKEKEVLGEDLVSVRELQLIPGQKHESLDKVTRSARYIGIVALFRKPSPQHWRYAFSTPVASQTGLTIGAHACAMSVQVGEPIGLPLSAVRSVAIACP
ncbi:type VI secretion system lipoprotein TssJ [Aquabacterium sp.]|uniref:type VI secretion system lipoprotein TssJ n=1 Tax=Aquabacterium sp. TaxID=1872578 RepID=UPI0025C65FF2|nr:type VI secretion system lipoprotein TssJ [Aquabacterium sp.]